MPSQAASSGSSHSNRTWTAFEIAWQDHVDGSDLRPRIETFLDLAAPDQRASALQNLLAAELRVRRSFEETPTAEEYVARFPEARELIAQVFLQFDTNAPTGGTTIFTNPAGENITAAVRYSGLSQIGEGGLGQVFRAEDEELRRPVAVKSLKIDHRANSEARQRFRMEAEVTGRLCHPGVVPVYTAGEGWDERPFYAMRLIEGQNFEEAIAQYHNTRWEPLGPGAKRLALHQLIGHLIAASETVAYAHHRDVLHLDIKPANIMLGRFGETMVVDWGLAQIIEHTRSLGGSRRTTFIGSQFSGSSSAKGAGTLGYMSPEQLSDSTDPVDARADVYSLGATLYHLLTDKRAFSGSDLTTVMQSIRQGNFRPPQDVNACPKPLAAVAMKAMSLRPDDRYASAEDFAAELKRWLADEPVRAHREALFERVVRTARRRKKLSIALAAATLLLLVAALATSLVFARMTQAADEARIAQLQNSAAFAAQQYGYEIDRRWRIASELAADAELPGLVQAASGQPYKSEAGQKLAQWLSERTGRYVGQGNGERWFIVDAKGIQLARNPFHPKLIGKSVRGRTYFHGGPADVPESDALKPTPICQPHLSPAFKSKSDGALAMAFSVPIWRTSKGLTGSDCKQAGNDIVGVLVVSVKLGDFVRQPPQDSSLVLVDLRPDTLGDNQGQKGLVLDHPLLKTGEGKFAAVTVHLPDELVQQLEVLRRERAKLGSKRHLPLPRLMRDYHDPAAANPSIPRIAACEPVFIDARDRDRDSRDTGLVVIIQERTADELPR